jgi:CubicO group peptidase (beta-lactamase class C family)
VRAPVRRSLRLAIRLILVVLLGLAAIAGMVIWRSFAGTLSLERDPADQAKGVARIQPLPYGVQSLDAELEPVRAAHRVPALAAAIIRGDRIVAMGAVGVRIAGSSVPVNITDRFHIGSCTKSMTATLIGMLVDQGALSWEMTLVDVFPDLAGRFHRNIAP